MSKRPRASVAFVLITLGLDAMGVGIIAPIVPGLVRELGHLPPERATLRRARLRHPRGGARGLDAAAGGGDDRPRRPRDAIGALDGRGQRGGRADTQGEMQGVLAAVEGLTAVVAPLLTAGLFYAFTDGALPVTFPGAPFALAAGFALLACLLLRKLA